MIQRKLDDIDEATLQQLIQNKFEEQKTLDYKREFPGNSDADKREFLADVASFVNTAGGDLVYGMEETGGIPTSICGIGISDLDAAILRLDQILQSGLEPRARITMRPVLCSSGPVLIVRCERSWAGPHRVKPTSKFWGRNSRGKFELDVAQLREAFTFSATVVERIRAFRIDRISALSNDDTDFMLNNAAKIVLHFLPIESFASQAQYDVLRLRHQPMKVPAPHTKGTPPSIRINLEGLMAREEDAEGRCLTYLQIYRTGTLEAVDALSLNPFASPSEEIDSSYEKTLLDYFPRCVELLQIIGVNVPVVFGITLTNIRGRSMARMPFSGSFPLSGGQPFPRDTLMIPEVLIEDFATETKVLLKPLFDVVWNAFGHPQSKNFDDKGNWINRR